MKFLGYAEGSWFALPLRTSGFAVGVVARMMPRGRVLCVYLFGPRRDSIPRLDELKGYRSEQALKCWRIGDLGLINGAWTVIGKHSTWCRELWPVPPFVRRSELATRAWRVTISDTNPNQVEREDPIPYDTNGMETYSLYGYGAVEIRLTKLLDP